MDYTREFRKYITSHQTNLAIRVTFSVVLPPIIFYHFDVMPIGVAMSLGALCTSLTDTPGPPHHRKNGILASIAVNFLTAIIVGLTNFFPVVVGVEVLVFSFLLSLIAIYGNRASSIGVLGLLILILNIDTHRSHLATFENAICIGIGGVWYAFLSFLLNQIFPYRLAQQALGESIISAAQFLRVKANFYRKDYSFDDAYTQLMKMQVTVQEQQAQVRELLFKSRRIVNDSTPKSRVLLMMFVDEVDLFERVMTSQQNYQFLHEQFDDTGILEVFYTTIHAMADELEEIGVAVQSSMAKARNVQLDDMVALTEKQFFQLRNSHIHSEKLEGLISLRHILSSVKDLHDRIRRMQVYTQYDEQTSKEYSKHNKELDYTRFVGHQPVEWRLMVDNISFHSQAFRHSLRFSVAMLVGFIVSQFLPFGHGYWILLSVSVILKPLFSSTKQLYFKRLGGTIVGAALGGVVLYFITDGPTLIVLLILAMIVGYSMQKTNYFIFSTFITVYVLIAFHFLYGHDFRLVMLDRIADTFIGVLIAMIASFILLPSWSYETMINSMREMIAANKTYFTVVARAYAGKPPALNDYKVARKEAFVALANLSDNFQRVLTEPKSKQKNIEFLQQFVVSNHMFTSHTASLSYYSDSFGEEYQSPDFEAVIEDVGIHLDNALQILDPAVKSPAAEHALPVMQNWLVKERVQQMFRKRLEEIQAGDIETDFRKSFSALKTIVDQFEIIHTVAADIEKSLIRFERG